MTQVAAAAVVMLTGMHLQVWADDNSDEEVLGMVIRTGKAGHL